METSTFEQRIEKLRNSKTIISSGLEYVGLSCTSWTTDLPRNSSEQIYVGTMLIMTRATLSESLEKVQKR